MSRPIRSTNVKTNNIVVQITVPKRTGRKRKRGSHEPYQHSEANVLNSSTGALATILETSTAIANRDAKTVLCCLRDNAERYTLKPVGSVEQTHRFRSRLISSFFRSYLLIRIQSHARLCLLHYKQYFYEENEGAHFTLRMLVSQRQKKLSSQTLIVA